MVRGHKKSSTEEVASEAQSRRSGRARTKVSYNDGAEDDEIPAEVRK